MRELELVVVVWVVHCSELTDVKLRTGCPSHVHRSRVVRTQRAHDLRHVEATCVVVVAITSKKLFHRRRAGLSKSHLNYTVVVAAPSPHASLSTNRSTLRRFRPDLLSGPRAPSKRTSRCHLNRTRRRGGLLLGRRRQPAALCASGDGATGNGARDSDVVGPGGEAPLNKLGCPCWNARGPAARVTVVVVVADSQRATRRHHDL